MTPGNFDQQMFVSQLFTLNQHYHNHDEPHDEQQVASTNTDG